MDHLSVNYMWLFFGAIVIGMMALDLGVFNRKSHVIRTKEAIAWCLVWFSTAMIFMIVVAAWHGQIAAMEFLTAYLVEQSLSVDNLFVFLLIFTHFKVPELTRHKVLFWGIIGAVVMRAIFIGAGVALINSFSFVIYIFGVILIWSGLKIGFKKEDDEIDFEKNFIIRFCRRFMRVSNRFEGDRFFVHEHGKWHATLLFVILLVVEATDVMFAFDSVPAVLAISKDPFIVYSSNIFAILGLRALYFALAGLMRLFVHLHYGLSIILVFVGVKMLIADFYKIPIGIALAIVAGILGLSIATALGF